MSSRRVKGATDTAMGLVTALDRGTADQISSVQVITDMRSVAKELVENSIDAGARNIEVTFVDHGVTTVRVVDDGHGLDLDRDGDVLGRRHATSKTFMFAAAPMSDDATAEVEDDARRHGEGVTPSHVEHAPLTLGFRGEALHSIRVTCDLTIASKAADGSCVRIVHASSSPPTTAGASANNSQRVSDEQLKSALEGRDSGTAVTASNIFGRFPVRRQDLEKNVRRQFQRAHECVRELALAHPSVRIHCDATSATTAPMNRGSRLTSHGTESITNDHRSLIFATSGSGDVLKAVVEIFGSRLALSLTEFCFTLKPTAPSSSPIVASSTALTRESQVTVKGLMSKQGQGRPTGDLQFCFLSGRPVELPLWTRTFSDAFIAANPAATVLQPVLFVSIVGAPEAAPMLFDVNLAPDKRQAFIANEPALLNQLRANLRDFFDGANSDRRQHRLRPSVGLESAEPKSPSSLATTLRTLSRGLTQLPALRAEDDVVNTTTPREQSTPRRRRVDVANDATDPSRAGQGGHEIVPATLRSFEPFLASVEHRGVPLPGGAASSNRGGWLGLFDDQLHTWSRRRADQQAGPSTRKRPRTSATQQQTNNNDTSGETVSTIGGPESPTTASHLAVPQPTWSHFSSPGCEKELSLRLTKEAFATMRVVGQFNRGFIVTLLSTSFNECASPQSRKSSQTTTQAAAACDDLAVKYQSDASAVVDAIAALADDGPTDGAGDCPSTDEESSRDADSSRPLGRGQPKAAAPSTAVPQRYEVFIVDQHAADEKSRYERLTHSYKATPQRLIVPAHVYLSAEESSAALRHANILERHGFLVRQPSVSTAGSFAAASQTPAATAGGVAVLSVPVLPHDLVRADDIQELTMQLAAAGDVVKPLRAVWHSMATKACRASIMIGATLDMSTMQRVVSGLARLDHPWNCPHGRPTLRHVHSVVI